MGDDGSRCIVIGRHGSVWGGNEKLTNWSAIFLCVLKSWNCAFVSYIHLLNGFSFVSVHPHSYRKYIVLSVRLTDCVMGVLFVGAGECTWQWIDRSMIIVLILITKLCKLVKWLGGLVGSFAGDWGQLPDDKKRKREIGNTNWYEGWGRRRGKYFGDFTITCTLFKAKEKRCDTLSFSFISQIQVR